MSEIRPFFFDDAPVRAIVDGQGNPWFVAKDVCEVLGISKYRDVLSGLDDDERVSTAVDTLGGPQRMTAVSESGLYALVFASRHSEARRFRKWVTGEVLPALRCEGRYALPGRPSALPTRPATLRLKQTVKATLLSCAVQMVKMREGHSEEVLPEFERLCAAVAGPDN